MVINFFGYKFRPSRNVLTGVSPHAIGGKIAVRQPLDPRVGVRIRPVPLDRIENQFSMFDRCVP